MKFSPDGKWIASCCEYASVILNYIMLTVSSGRLHNQDLGCEDWRTRRYPRGPPCRHIDYRVEPRLEGASVWIG